MKEGRGGPGFGGDDLFSMFFGGGSPFGGGGGRHHGPRRGQDIGHELRVTLEDLYNGKTKKMAIQRQVICKKCDGKGGNGSPVKCSACRGSGVQGKISPVNLIRYLNSSFQCVFNAWDQWYSRFSHSVVSVAARVKPGAQKIDAKSVRVKK